MRGEGTLVMLLYAAGALWILKLWWSDMLENRALLAGEEADKATLPGAFPASILSLMIAVIGAVGLVGLETWGEYALEINESQEVIAKAFLLAMLAAAVIEEVIFRGYCVVTKKGKTVLWLSILFFSAVFALIHPYLWEVTLPENYWLFWEIELNLKLDTKGLFSTGFVFLNSLWFYTVRFMPTNPQASLLPCFVAHASSNLGVFVIKYWQGFVA